VLNALVDLRKRILGGRTIKQRREDSKLSRKLVKSTKPQENILGVWLQLLNFEEDVKLFLLLIAIQFFLTSVLVLLLLLVV